MSIDQFAPGVSTRDRGQGARAGLTRLAALAEREIAVVSVLAFYGVVLLAAMPYLLVQDSWLALVSGREVLTNGLPQGDMLAVWTSGVPWIDQQWLAHVAFYGLASAGGVRLALLAHVGLLLVGFGGALLASRSLGASAKSTALAGGLCMFLAPWGLQLRAQSLAIPLFVALLWLLAADSRAPSRRVLLVLPLLVLWANVHGTVALAALLVALRGVTIVVRGLRDRDDRPARWLWRSLALGVLPFACLFASPYGLALGDYYRAMLVSPLLRTFIEEWGASVPSPTTAPFYVMAVIVVGLLVRHRSRLTGFEQVALLALLTAGVSAIRSITWFALAAAVFLPLLLDGLLQRRGSRRRAGQRQLRRFDTLRRPVAVGALVAVAVSLAVVALRPASWWTAGWPSAGAADVAAAVAERPGAKVFADDRYADWLIWEQPTLAGRVAYDIRFELFTRRQLEELRAFRRHTGDGWLRAIAGYDVLVVDHPAQPTLVADVRAARDFEVSYRDSWLTVLVERPA